MPRLPFSLALVATALTLIPGLSMAASSKDNVSKKTAYGAIAWHRDTSSIGYSHDLLTARKASVAALENCGHERCEIVLNITNECGALARGARGHAAKKGNTRAEAETLALKACGKDCRPIAWACTR